MPRARTGSTRSTLRQPKDFSNEDLIYLAGVFECVRGGLKNAGTSGATYVSDSETWTNYMATKYGGTADSFLQSDGKKWIQGWYVPVQRRLELVQLLEKADTTRGTTPLDFDKFRGRLQKAASKSADGDGGHEGSG